MPDYSTNVHSVLHGGTETATVRSISARLNINSDQSRLMYGQCVRKEKRWVNADGVASTRKTPFGFAEYQSSCRPRIGH